MISLSYLNCHFHDLFFSFDNPAEPAWLSLSKTFVVPIIIGLFVLLFTGFGIAVGLLFHINQYGKEVQP